MRTIPLLAAAILCGRLPAAEPAIADVLKEWPQGGGFAIVLGASDPGFLAGLSNEGRMLVHGLCQDDAVRDRLRAQLVGLGLYGLAAVARWEDAPRLPYASRLADLIVADLDGLGGKAPAMAELERALAPDGVLYLRAGGAWKATRSQRPAGLDGWGHFDHGADGNPLSQDRISGPVRQQQWVAEAMPYPAEGNPAGYDPGGGLRVSGRYAICDINDAGPRAEDRKQAQKWALQARDAWNGTPLWTLPRAASVARKRWSLVADAGAVYTYLEPGSDLVAIDAASGRTLRSYPGTAPQRADGKAGTAGPEGETACLRVGDDVLLASVNGVLRCFDKPSAAQRWVFEREGQMVLAPVVDAGRKRVYALMARRAAERNFQGRWLANAQVLCLVALDLADGKPVWECPEVASVDVQADSKGKARTLRRAPGQIVVCGDKVVVFGNAAISGGESPYIASIDAAGGKLLFADDAPIKREYNVAAYNILARDGMIWLAGAFTWVWRYDPSTGKTEKVIGYAWNQRCTRLTATPDWLLFGQSGWYGRDFSGEQVAVARSGCALGNIPANGLTYFSPNACGCITMVRGFHAMSGEAVDAAVPDGERLRSGGTAPALSSAPADRLPAGPIAEDWPKSARLAALSTPVLAVGDLAVTAIVHQHRVEARRGATLVWTAMADARISGPPILAGDSVVYGAHDGCVYGVSAKDGSPRFRYLVAPSRRLVVSNAQLESAWPVYGLALMDGKVIASAGTHPGIGGGVAVVALDPGTGSPAWRTMLAQSPNVIPAGGGRGARIADHSFMNSIPRIEGGSIVLGEGGRQGSFSFQPGDTAEVLGKRLSEPPARKK